MSHRGHLYSRLQILRALLHISGLCTRERHTYLRLAENSSIGIARGSMNLKTTCSSGAWAGNTPTLARNMPANVAISALHGTGSIRRRDSHPLLVCTLRCDLLYCPYPLSSFPIRVFFSDHSPNAPAQHKAIQTPHGPETGRTPGRTPVPAAATGSAAAG